MGITLITQRATNSFTVERKALGGGVGGTGEGVRGSGTTRRRKEWGSLGSQRDPGVRDGHVPGEMGHSKGRISDF